MTAVGLVHAEALAAIHASAFPPAEQWGAPAMASLLALPTTFGFIEAPGGFVLARAAGGEAEILTLAVHPAVRRRGLARKLLARVLDKTGGDPVFLEVAADNAAAQALYRSSGFVPCGQRPGYYGPGRDAVILRR